MVYTVAFGVSMYLTMRVTGFIIWAMVLHGLTDPTGILASGGIDKMPGSDGSSALADAVGLVTIVMVVIWIPPLLRVQGKVGEPREVTASRRNATGTVSREIPPGTVSSRCANTSELAGTSAGPSLVQVRQPRG